MVHEAGYPCCHAGDLPENGECWLVESVRIDAQWCASSSRWPQPAPECNQSDSVQESLLKPATIHTLHSDQTISVYYKLLQGALVHWLLIPTMDVINLRTRGWKSMCKRCWRRRKSTRMRKTKNSTFRRNSGICDRLQPNFRGLSVATISRTFREDNRVWFLFVYHFINTKGRGGNKYCILL